MKLLKFFRSLGIIATIVSVIFILNHPLVKNRIVQFTQKYQPNLKAVPNLNAVPNLKNVKGINTTRAASVSSQLQTDVNNQINQVKAQALNLRVSDFLQFFSRAQKIPMDLKFVQNYVQTQITNFTKHSSSNDSISSSHK